MKRLLLSTIACVLLGLTNINAQNDDETTINGFVYGDTYISGSISFTSDNFAYSDENINQYSITPSIGFFINDNLALELGVIVGKQLVQSYNNGYQSYTNNRKSFGGQLGLLYFLNPENQFSFFFAGGLSYQTAKDEIDDDKLKTFVVAAYPGINYFVSESFALRASLGEIYYISSKYGDADSSGKFGLNIDFSSVNFGVTYKF